MFSYILWSVAVAWVVSAAAKMIISCSKAREFSLVSAVKYGGMPSGHSAVVVALTAAIYLSEGLSSIFAISAIFSIIVISDLMIINGHPKAHTLSRHTVPQVLVGSLIGLASAVVFRFLLSGF